MLDTFNDLHVTRKQHGGLNILCDDLSDVEDGAIDSLECTVRLEQSDAVSMRTFNRIAFSNKDSRSNTILQRLPDGMPVTVKLWGVIGTFSMALPLVHYALECELNCVILQTFHSLSPRSTPP